MKLKAILFDLGGTLLHYYDPHEEDLKHSFRRVTRLGIQAVLAQLPPQHLTQSQLKQLPEIIERHIDQSYLAMRTELQGGCIEAPVRAGLSEIGIPIDDTWWADLRSYLYQPVDQTVSLRQGADTTLASLRDAGYRLGLISNTFWAADLHDRHLAEYGLLDFLTVRIYSSDAPYQKPHPSILLLALERIGVCAQEAAYVGDRVDVDVEGSQQVGMRGILIRSPYQPASLNGRKPDAIVEELPGLIAALAELQAAADTAELETGR